MKQSGVILLVENDRDHIYDLEQAFRKSGIRNPLRVARYGNEAILYLRGIGVYGDRTNYPLPRLVVLDMTNPDGSGMTVLGWIREQESFSHVPIVVLTQEGQEREIQNIFDQGIHACPVHRGNLAKLCSIVRSLKFLAAPAVASIRDVVSSNS